MLIAWAKHTRNHGKHRDTTPPSPARRAARRLRGLGDQLQHPHLGCQGALGQGLPQELLELGLKSRERLVQGFLWDSGWFQHGFNYGLALKTNAN